MTVEYLREPVEVSEAKLDAMRSLQFGEEEGSCNCMVDNFRPPCDLKGRTVMLKTSHEQSMDLDEYGGIWSKLLQCPKDCLIILGQDDLRMT